MIHIAMALLILSLTCVALSIATYVVPGVADAGVVFVSGSVAATAISGGFSAYVWRARL